MNLVDKVYGLENVEEKILIELINCDSVQRLKEISQYGIPDRYYHHKGFSRYEHSVGVFILLKRLGANLEEQVAGLLHDVSHTAFSHVVDWFNGDPTKEEYQDKIHLKIIENSEIPDILEKQGIDYKRISNFENFSLLEKDSPSLCVDRFDYSVRELEKEKGFNFVKEFVCNILNKNGQMVFPDKEIAERFARQYMELNKVHWSGEQSRIKYYLLAETLKIAEKEKIISFNDLRKTDAFVLNLLEKSKNREVLDNLNLLKTNIKIKEVKGGIELKKKFRYIDPEISINGSIKKLSQLSRQYFDFLRSERENSQLVKKIKVVRN